MRLGVPELILLVVVALILFGPGRLPELGKAMGRAIREFKDSVRGGSEPEKTTPPEAGKQV